MVPPTVRAEQPGYRRLASALREQIRAQTWDEDEPLPTDGELEKEHRVSRQTVRRAYLELVNEGLVYRVPGRGTFVTPSRLRYHRPFETVDDLLSLSEDTELEVVEALAGTYDDRAAAQLQLTTRLMYGMRFVRRHQGVVFCATDVYLPLAVGQVLEDEATFLEPGLKTTRTVIGALADHGIQISGAEQSMTARAADELTAPRLGCSVGHPLLHVERLYVDASGRPVEWAVSDFLPEHYTHRLRLGRRSMPSPSLTAAPHPPKGTPE
ncbi:GntR family transcriptional regulator [Ornithinimicrobium tianjinense]|uniref:GntR family transcriptional regulator n=1 Tax=Ornithinimicrobium tianjinense TaxID=1195761 RepID=A0A917F2V7_9MICO|nr:GntR family transcriptional regulator [Ornithinimicrobium tianjinense]GGF39446.1 GntR family transcriptional regulator [Ornithinimicrobium tianjinense]